MRHRLSGLEREMSTPPTLRRGTADFNFFYLDVLPIKSVHNSKHKSMMKMTISSPSVFFVRLLCHLLHMSVFSIRPSSLSSSPSISIHCHLLHPFLFTIIFSIRFYSPSSSPSISIHCQLLIRFYSPSSSPSVRLPSSLSVCFCHHLYFFTGQNILVVKLPDYAQKVLGAKRQRGKTGICPKTAGHYRKT